jgi:hypothetical protein
MAHRVIGWLLYREGNERDQTEVEEDKVLQFCSRALYRDRNHNNALLTVTKDIK